MNSNLYIPAGANTFVEMQAPQLRVGIQGSPKSGKTTSALTFPNPIVLNLDRGLGGHKTRADCYEVPMWNADFIKKLTPNDKTKKEAILKWLNDEATKLTASQTLVIDGLTGIQNVWDIWIQLNPFYTKAGKIDDFAPWREKIAYMGYIFDTIKTLKCHVVLLTHETPDRDKEGELNGKLRPLLTGQFGDQLASHFTDWFRQHAYEKPTKFDKADEPKIMDKYGMNIDEFKAMCESFTNTRSIFVWQTQQDNMCNAACSSIVGQSRFIKADYETLIKYTKK